MKKVRFSLAGLFLMVMTDALAQDITVKGTVNDASTILFQKVCLR